MGNSQELTQSQEQNATEDEKRLAEAKSERLKMEQAAVTLENRILYLEKLTSKMNKKIESAKTRVNEIMKLKKQSLEEQESKKQFIEQKEITLLEKRNKVQEFKASQEEKLNKSKIDHMTQSITTVKTAKEDLQVLSLDAAGEIQAAEGRDDEDEPVQRSGDPGHSQERTQSKEGADCELRRRRRRRWPRTGT